MMGSDDDVGTAAAAGSLPLRGSADAGTGNVPFSPCGAPWKGMELTGIDMIPLPPHISETVTENWNFISSAFIDKGAHFREMWKLGTMVVLDRTVDLCSVFNQAGLACPVEPGYHTAQYRYDIDVEIPPFVSLAVHREFFNSDGSRLLCYDTRIKFVP